MIENLTNKYEITTIDNHCIPLFYFQNNNKSKPQAIIQIIHGMSENTEYYLDFIKYFNNQNYDIFSHDQRGHGMAVKKSEDFGFTAQNNGGEKLINDTLLVTNFIINKYPNIPIILLGHSMGALIAISAAAKASKNNNHYYKSLILTGTPGYTPAIKCILGKLCMKFEILRQKSIKKISPIAKFIVGNYFNYRFRHEHTLFAWSTRDKYWLDKFLADPKCGFIPPNIFWLDLIYLLENIKNIEIIKNINKDLNILFLDGSEDPINNRTKYTKKYIKLLNKLKFNNITHKIYQGARHHLCIETNRNEVFNDINNYLSDTSI